MKVLWITGSLTEELRAFLGMNPTVNGGWISSGSVRLGKDDSIELAIASVHQGMFRKIHLNRKIYYLLPQKKGKTGLYDASLEGYWRHIKTEFQPHVIHIFGTEFPLGLSFINACGSNNVLVSIQGLISRILDYYYAGISPFELFRNMTIGDILFKQSFLLRRLDMVKRSAHELDYLKKALYFEGRTEWDKSIIWANNHQALYFSCDRFLRPSFYKNDWKLINCHKHTIFLSTAKNPFKGVHQVFKALPFILQEFPDTKIYIAGGNLFDRSTLKRKLLFNGYSKYLYRLAKRLHILGNITFTGVLLEEEYCSQLLKSNVFVCPSSIENSPNALAEAQILGVPSIGAFVGGIPDMIDVGKTGLLYRFEEHEMLAKLICDIFRNDSLAVSISESSKNIVRKRHNIDDIYSTLLNIYEEVSLTTRCGDVK